MAPPAGTVVGPTDASFFFPEWFRGAPREAIPDVVPTINVIIDISVLTFRVFRGTSSVTKVIPLATLPTSGGGSASGAPAVEHLSFDASLWLVIFSVVAPSACGSALEELEV